MINIIKEAEELAQEIGTDLEGLWTEFKAFVRGKKAEKTAEAAPPVEPPAEETPPPAAGEPETPPAAEGQADEQAVS